jgi:RecA/RadA recombinase
MAKKKEVGQSLDFASLVKEFQKIVPETDVASSEQFQIIHYVPTGNYLLNAQISGKLLGGLPVGKMLLLAGDPGAGKTFLTLNICREAQKKYGTTVIWYDTESAMDTETMQRLGVDTDNAIIIPIKNVEKLTHSLLNFLENVPRDKPCPYIIVIDSIGMLSSIKELEDSSTGNDKRDMTKQQRLKTLFKTTLVDCGNKQIPIIATSHTYASMNPYGKPKEISGGSGSLFSAGVTLMLRKKLMKKDDDVSFDETEYDEQKTGVIITSSQEKARYSKQGLDVSIQVPFTKGMNKFWGLEEYLDWEHCGVAPGKMVEEVIETTTDTGKIKKVKTGNLIFEPSTSGTTTTWAIRSLNKHIKNNEFWKYAKHIFTKENMIYLNEVCTKKFAFAEYSGEDLEDLEEIVENNYVEVSSNTISDDE